MKKKDESGCSIFAFTAIFTFFVLIFNNLYTWGKILKFAEIENIADAILPITIFIGVYLLLFIFFTLIFYKITVKILSILIIFICGLCSYFISTYGIVIDRFMIANVFSTDFNEVIGLFSWKMIVYFVFLIFIPIIVITRVKVKSISISLRIRILLLALFLALVVILPNYVKLAAFFRKHNSLGGYFVPSNFISSSITYAKYIFKSKAKPILIDDAVITKNNDVLIVLVVGETARKKNFSLYGYSRKTNPLLEKEKITSLNATSCGTSTNVSVPCIFSPSAKSDFDHLKYENMISMLKRLNVKISWLENNFGGCYGLCDDVEKQYFNGSPDGIMLESFEGKLKNLSVYEDIIVLHQNGSHGPLYFQRYTENFNHFKPSCNRADVSKCKSQELFNAYDNTILYTDFFLHTIISKLKGVKKPVIMIYASDHGESLGEYGLFLHGFPYNLAPKEQKEIPFIIWANDSFEKKYYNLSKIDKNSQYSHDNIFHTTLGILNVKTKYYDKNLDIFKKN
ncbi:phosphoethanolamine transferase [Candidatus Deianiraea vastatrix]|uniref:EptA-like lipid A phosphoethanolamine transferase n=1 Tax=Candidatus Deianiraea vastatrix TaxID=2163644 RepID=A0A5B8XBY6_9RICK|nr:sulfatase-like hydrolase/transferase [Candidatus Deianiraea vastatrix]QED22862.1 Putative EptA-like lipid A phosphoethanolamine transferase [Candidatus Deianiraea vastatrix]